MSHASLIPAYGRDYKTAKAAREDFLTGKDFYNESLYLPDGKVNMWAGKAASLDEIRDLGYNEVNIRYDRQRKVVVVKVPKKEMA